jgi:hypothetical protein
MRGSTLRFEDLRFATRGRNSKNLVLTGTENGIKLVEQLWKGNIVELVFRIWYFMEEFVAVLG